MTIDSALTPHSTATEVAAVPLAAAFADSEQAALIEEIGSLRQLLTELQPLQQNYAQLTAQHRTLVEQYEREQRLMLIVQRLRQSLDPHEILEQTVTAVQQLLQVEQSIIYQLNASGEAVVVAEASVERSMLGSQKVNPLLGNKIAATPTKVLLELCQQSGAVAIHRIDRTTPPALLAFGQPSTALLVTSIGQDYPLGIISVHQQDSRRWQPYEVELLQQLATDVAIALHHSQLYQQAQQQNIDLERQVQQRTEQLEKALNYESMLKRITERVRDCLDERSILEAAVQELTVILKLAGCNAALYDLNQGTSTIHYEYTQSIPASQGRVAHMEDFPEIYQQLQQGWCFQFCSLLPNPARGRVAMLTCPIFVDPHASRSVSQGVDQSVLGDLWLIHQPHHRFDDHEIRLVQQVASQCAIAIRQARLYQTAQVQVQELAELNRLKDEFLSTVSHELRTPITNVKMAIQMLRTSATEEKRLKYLSILEQEAIREADLINDLLNLQQLQAMPQPLELELLSLPEWIPQLIEPFQPRFAARQQTVQVYYPPDVLPIVSEPASLRRILAELLNNACKYTVPGGQIHLAIELDSEADGVAFIIGNQAGISAAELPKIFGKFYRCPDADPWKQGGTGLGLALVQKLVERLQGEIQVTSTNGWTQFTIQLPSLLEAAES